MSARKDYVMALAGTDLSKKTKEELRDLFSVRLNAGVHGMCFSPYEDGQQPGDQLTEQQIRRRLEIIRPYTKWVRSFSCTDGNELIPGIAKEYGMKTLVGAWLGKSEGINALEISNLIKIAKSGAADIVAVGNEVLYRNDLSEEILLDYILRVKNELPGVPVGYVDAYYEFGHRPKITEACDVILANCYPYWEGCNLEYALLYMKDMYNRAIAAANGKPVIITETGWPSKGEKFHGAQPSFEGAMRYFISTQEWSRNENIDVFYFSSFDENWKIGDEGDVGAYWGIWDKNEQSKFTRDLIMQS